MNRKKFLKYSLLAPVLTALEPFKNLVSYNDCDGVLDTNNKNVSYIKPSDASYNNYRKGFNKRINKFPAVIALCNNTTGVAEAIQYASKNNLAVAVKSGGHCMEGFSSNNGGLVINLSAMRKMQWVNNETIKVNPACTLKEIYDFILPRKKIIPGGSCAGVGIGGLTLGGGYGLLARKFGLTCDSLEEITMVDGEGKIHTAKAGSELLWACKGGNSGNFGVVTELTFKVHNAPNFMQSFRFKSFKTTTEKSKQILKKWFHVTSSLPESCFSAFVQNGKTTYILITNAGTHNSALQRAIEELKSVTETFTQTQPTPLANALKVYYGKTTPLYFKNASAGLYNSYRTLEPVIEKVLDIVLSTPGMIYQINTLGGKIQDASFENVSAFPHRTFNYFSELQTYWEVPSQEKKLLERFQQVQEIITGKSAIPQYRNYPDINFPNAPEIYYGAHYKKLQNIKKLYDAKNLFRYEQSIK